MIPLIVFQICIGALCGAYTVVGLIVAFYALCAVCRSIHDTLYRKDSLPD